MYLTYSEFKELSNLEIEESKFNHYELTSRKFIRYYTQKRSDEGFIGDYKDEIRECMVYLIELEKEKEDAKNDLKQGLTISRQGIASETVTDHSITFTNQSDIKMNELENSYKQRTVNIVREHLLWTGMLYRGI